MLLRKKLKSRSLEVTEFLVRYRKTYVLKNTSRSYKSVGPNFVHGIAKKFNLRFLDDILIY